MDKNSQNTFENFEKFISLLKRFFLLSFLLLFILYVGPSLGLVLVQLNFSLSLYEIHSQVQKTLLLRSWGKNRVQFEL